MERRQTVIEKFSTLLDVQEDSQRQLITRWKRNPVWENHMRLQMESCPDAGIRFWLRYWLSEARSDNSVPLAAQHLYAALQEACYWAGRKTYNQLPTQELGVRDYIQIAQLAASNPVAIFKKYDDSKGMTLESYGQLQLESTTKDTVRKGKEATRHSDWGLLRALNRKRNALQQAGIREPQLSRCLLAWQCFTEIYNPTKVRRQLQQPKPEEYAAFAERYNQLRFPQSQSPALSGDDIETLLQMCILAARASTRTPRFISRDDPNYIWAARASTKIPRFISRDDPDYLEEEEDLDHPNQEHLRPPTPDEQAETEEQWQQVRVVLKKALAELPESGQTMLQLHHGLGLKQQDLAREMSLKQYQVSRKLQSYKRPVLQALAEWTKNQTGKALSPEEINKLSQPLNPWLDWYYQESYHEFLLSTLVGELSDEILLVKLYYGQELSLVEVVSELNLDATEVNQRLEQIKRHLQSRLCDWVKAKYNLSPDALKSAAKPTAALVEEWLTNAKYSSFEI